VLILSGLTAKKEMITVGLGVGAEKSSIRTKSAYLLKLVYQDTDLCYHSLMIDDNINAISRLTIRGEYLLMIYASSKFYYAIHHLGVEIVENNSIVE
jgi:hypothetical protein